MQQPPSIPPSFPPQQASAKKGMPALAWVGIGCGGLLVVALALGVYGFFVAKKKLDEFAANPEKTAAELMVSMNPDMEMVSQDEAEGTMTIRTKDGDEMTLSYNDIAEGRIVVTDKDGNTTRIGSADLSQVPAWVPKAPGLTDGVSSYHSETSEEITGLFTGNSSRGTQDLRTFFEGEATSLGMTNRSSSSMESGGTSTVSLGFEGGGKSLNIVLTGKPGDETLVNTNYSEKK